MATMSIFINLVVIPARMRTLLIMSLTYIIALPGFLAVFTELPSGDIVSAFIMTLGASVIGYLGAFRYRLPSRQVWAKNQLLNLEIDAHKTTLVAQQKLENTLRQQAFTDVLTGAAFLTKAAPCSIPSSKRPYSCLTLTTLKKLTIHMAITAGTMC